jgi:hypothetical protein
MGKNEIISGGIMRAFFLALILLVGSAVGQEQLTLQQQIDKKFEQLAEVRKAQIRRDFRNPRDKSPDEPITFPTSDQKRERLREVEREIIELRNDAWFEEEDKTRYLQSPLPRVLLPKEPMPRVIRIHDCEAGEIGVFHHSGESKFKVLQIVSEGIILATKSNQTCCLVNVDTSNLTDESEIRIHQVEVLKPYSYTAVSGSTKTVPQFKMLDGKDAVAAKEEDRKRIEKEIAEAKEQDRIRREDTERIIKEAIQAIREKRTREWTMVDGTKLKASLRSYETFPREVVTVILPDGEPKFIKMPELSKEDQGYVRKTLGLER